MDANITAAEPFVREPGAGSTLNVLGVTHICKATGAETGGLSRSGKTWFRRAPVRRRTSIFMRTRRSM